MIDAGKIICGGSPEELKKKYGKGAIEDVFVEMIDASAPTPLQRRRGEH